MKGPYYCCILLLLFLTFTLDSVHAQQGNPANGKGKNKGESSGAFNCKRPGASCYGTAACTMTDDNELLAECSCDDDMMGSDCSHNTTARAIQEPCSIRCENEATCVDAEEGAEETAECLCTEGYYGPRCSKKRVSHVCKHDSMVFTMNPNMGAAGTFQGAIYLLENEGDDKCILEVTQDEDGDTVLRKQVPFTACGGAKNETDEEENTVMSFMVVIQYSSLYITKLDDVYTFKCLLRKSGSEIEWDSVIGSDEEKADLRDLHRGEEEQTLNPIKLEILGEDDAPLDPGPQKMGTPIKLKFILDGGDVYDKFRLDTITATNSHPDPDKALELNMVEHGCVNKEARSIVKGLSGDQREAIELTFSLFKFLHSNAISFKNIVKLCKGGEECNMTVCEDSYTAATLSEDFKGLGRKRRDVSSTVNNEGEQESSGEVEDPSDYREVDATLLVDFPQSGPQDVYYSMPGYYPSVYGQGATRPMRGDYMVQAPGGRVEYPPMSAEYLPVPGLQPGMVHRQQTVYQPPIQPVVQHERTEYRPMQPAVQSDRTVYHQGPVVSSYPVLPRGRTGHHGSVTYNKPATYEYREKEICTQSLVLLIVAIVLAVLLAISLGCCLYYCIKAHNARYERRDRYASSGKV